MNKIIYPLGIVAGIAISIAMLYPLSSVNFDQIGEESTGYIEMLLVSIGSILSMFIITTKYPDIKFSQLIKYGIFTAIISIIILYISSVIYFKHISPSYLTNYVNALTVKRSAIYTDPVKQAEFIANAERDRATYTNPYLYSLIFVVTRFMLSLMPIAIFGYILFRVNRWKNFSKNTAK